MCIRDRGKASSEAAVDAVGPAEAPDPGSLDERADDDRDGEREDEVHEPRRGDVEEDLTLSLIHISEPTRPY